MDTAPTARRRLVVLLASGALGVAYLLALAGRHPLRDPDDPFGASMVLLSSGIADLALLTAALGLLVSAAALSSRRSTPRRRGLLAVSSAVPALLLLDHSVIMMLGYVPMLAVLAITGRLHVVDTLWSGGMTVQAFAVAGVVAVLLELAHVEPPRREPTEALERARRTTRRWTSVAIGAPLAYGVSRALMFLQVPGFVAPELDDATRWAALGLGVASVIGAVLTWGLVCAWGERFPRWVPGLAGRGVPVGLAVVPALAVATMVMAASRMMALQVADGGSALVDELTELPLVALPHLLWPAWSVALAGAALSYRRRRVLQELVLSRASGTAGPAGPGGR